MRNLVTDLDSGPSRPNHTVQILWGDAHGGLEVGKVADEVADMVMDIKIDRPRQTRTDQRYLAYLEKG